MRREARYDFVQRLLGSGFDLGHGLILDWMGYVDRIEVRPTQGRGLRACRQLKFVCGHRHGRYAPIFEPD